MTDTLLMTRLSVRSYSLTARSHAHTFCQVVVPLQGSIEIGLNPFTSLASNPVDQKASTPVDQNTQAIRPETQATQEHCARIGPGQGVLIQANQVHRFAADQQARFLVADMPTLPAALQSLAEPFIAISDSLLSFCHFAEIQLNHEHDMQTETLMSQLFMQLLEKQQQINLYDARIQKVTEYLARDLSQTPALSELASLACLSLSQYKSRFKDVTGLSTGQYLTRLRMEKARALLMHTDYPINLVAFQTGYQDASAFSRRFRAWYGTSPRTFRP